MVEIKLQKSESKCIFWQYTNEIYYHEVLTVWQVKVIA